jgi:hypothetical protein
VHPEPCRRSLGVLNGTHRTKRKVLIEGADSLQDQDQAQALLPTDPYSKNSNPVSFFFPYSFSLVWTAEKLTGHMPAFWIEFLIVRTVNVPTNLREVSEEGLNVIFRLERVNRVHDALLLECLPLPETTHVGGLDEVGRELDDPNTVHFSFKNELMTCSPVDQENSPRLIRAAVVVFDEMVQPSYTNLLYNQMDILLQPHDFMKPGLYDCPTRHNYYGRDSLAVRRNALDNRQ